MKMTEVIAFNNARLKRLPLRPEESRSPLGRSNLKQVPLERLTYFPIKLITVIRLPKTENISDSQGIAKGAGGILIQSTDWVLFLRWVLLNPSSTCVQNHSLLTLGTVNEVGHSSTSG